MSGFTRKSIRLLMSITIWGLMVSIWGYVWYECYADNIQLPFFRRGNWMMIAVYAVLLLIITQFYGGYRVGFYRRGDIIFSCILSMVITNTLTYLQVSLVGRQFMNGWPVIWMSAADFVLLWLWATAADKLYYYLNPPRYLLCIYGESRLAKDLVIKMAMRDDKYIIKEAVSIDEGIVATIERMEDYKAVLICDIKGSRREILLQHCYEHDIRAYVTPRISDILVRGAGIIHLFDSPLLLSQNRGLSFEQRIAKRALDIIVSVLSLLLFSPFMLIIAAAVKLCDGGTVLYRQERLTFNGKRFMVYKFRSMVADAEKQNGARLSNKNDERITPVGKAIRKIRFDELPQLWNILRGDMSLVGPRPERPEIAEEYKKIMPEFDYRLKVKAGLTGYAQVLGKYNTTPQDKLKLDLMYIMEYSFLLDIKLILMTIKILFMKQSTEGIEDGQKDSMFR